MPLDPKPLKVEASCGEKDHSSVRCGRKNQITVVGCVSAGGSVLQLIIWNGKSLCPSQAIGEIPGNLHGFSLTLNLLQPKIRSVQQLLLIAPEESRDSIT